jgi:hypothetical protein
MLDTFFWQILVDDTSDVATVSFADLDQGREISSRFSLPKSMKHSVEIWFGGCNWTFLPQKTPKFSVYVK